MGGRMSVLQAIILGLTQGATEYAPVSSSGHLILVPWLFGWDTILANADLNKTFDVALHMGTLLGALVYFRDDIVRYLRAFVASVRARNIEDSDQRIAWALVVGTIPGVIVGAMLENVIQEDLSQPWLIAVTLAVFGVVLWAVDRWARRDRPLDSIGVRTGLYLGVAQALALQPGVSRSGITMTAARAIGIEREASARFSFLLSLPVIAGAGAYKATDLAKNGFGGYGSEFLWGFVASAISGYIVIAVLLRYLRNHGFAVFMWYRIALAALCLGLIAVGVRDATI
jgi:undecaprenyl-diphosphatase